MHAVGVSCQTLTQGLADPTCSLHFLRCLRTTMQTPVRYLYVCLRAVSDRMGQGFWVGASEAWRFNLGHSGETLLSPVLYRPSATPSMHQKVCRCVPYALAGPLPARPVGRSVRHPCWHLPQRTCRQRHPHVSSAGFCLATPYPERTLMHAFCNLWTMATLNALQLRRAAAVSAS